VQNRYIFIIRLLLTALLSINIQTFALEILSVNDIIYREQELLPQKLEQLQWLPNSYYFSYVNKEQDLIIADVHNKIIKNISLDMLNSTLESQAKTFPQITWIDQVRLWFQHEQNIIIYDTQTGIFEIANILRKEAENIEVFSPYLAAYTIGPNLFISNLGNITQLTDNPPSSQILSGHSVHRQEFGIDKGIFWSPHGTSLAYYRMDQSMVDDYPLEDFQAYPVKIRYIKYPMAGRKNHEVKLIIYNLESKNHTILDTQGPPDQYITSVSWSNDEQILLNILNRAQNYLRTYLFDVKNNKTQELLFEHRAKKYINPRSGFYTAPEYPQEALWCSPHDGWVQLYKLDTRSKSMNLLTLEPKDISEAIGFRASGAYFFYTAFSTNHPSRHGYFYDRNTNSITNLTQDREGMHTLIPSSDGEFILDVFSNQSTPYEVNLINLQGQVLNIIYRAPNPLIEYQNSLIKIITLRSSDNKYDLFARIIFPPNFSPRNTYAAILYVYGGPGVQIVQDSWGAPLWQLMMAQKGYIIFSLDNRGSAHRGQAFEQETFRALGQIEVLDQIVGINYLKSLNYVDMTRIGVHGWSFGGYMTIALMLKNPGVFKAGLEGGGVIDWTNYESPYTERYMGLPQENAEGYEASNLLNLVDNLNGHLMLISGTHDDVVVPRHTKLFITKAIEFSKPIDTFFYPYQKHHFDIKSKFHLYNKIVTYFGEKL